MKKSCFLCAVFLFLLTFTACKKENIVVDTASFVRLELKNKTFDQGSYDGNSFYDEMNVHQVKFTYDIEMCNHEVTQKEWLEVFSSNPSSFVDNVANGEKQENRPVESVSWYAAVAYCNKLSLMQGKDPCYTIEGVDFATLKYDDIPILFDDAWNAVKCNFTKNGYRLPTTAEWEFAARGGEHSTDVEIWPGTLQLEDLTDYLWNSDNAKYKTHEVNLKKPNGYGLYDMGGNVWEWCWDWYFDWIAAGLYSNRYDDFYMSAPETDPTGPETGSFRVVRGGAWNSFPRYCRVSSLYYYRPVFRFASLGFRVVCTIVE